MILGFGDRLKFSISSSFQKVNKCYLGMDWLKIQKEKVIRKSTKKL